MSGPLKITSPVDAETYSRITQFYAHQMQLLDERAAEEWADGFTEDGVFEQNVKPEPWSGRAVIAERMRAGMDRLAQLDVQRRHWFGMVAAQRQDAGTVLTRYYAMVFETPRGGRAATYLSTTGEDVLVVQDGQWRVRHRLITHDGT
ncbi:nuclear transport factor 2 family protein [Streptomyces sp. NPDC005930]|uniref:nuclear transport factor 2 family protein n=1 Tax=Streptomyces sp. NPDC005930 TaxID=3364736 RepID=UPI0036C43B00